MSLIRRGVPQYIYCISLNVDILDTSGDMHFPLCDVCLLPLHTLSCWSMRQRQRQVFNASNSVLKRFVNSAQIIRKQLKLQALNLQVKTHE
ncbi:unnamed protein product [Ceratitis capitata]|uniref:(Mediterranean fruit fly) hypothetical protein n=1 Tax=Ceratitis capitata TaxID=7213 RepID=A0A811VD99_CERCA|nr:unnamed protein product [Ceratitis capitata]